VKILAFVGRNIFRTVVLCALAWILYVQLQDRAWNFTQHEVLDERRGEEHRSPCI